MAEKDIAEKTLEAYNDVFADIVNVLLFNGKEIILPDDLEDAATVSQYKADEKVHVQERDVAKTWRNCNIRIAFLGIENQTAIDLDMPLRVLSYDGASYRMQLLDKKNGQKRVPVVTMVLYFGEKRWSSPLSLTERLEIPDVLKPYVSDYKINVFEICYLTDEQVAMFKSDFRAVADFFVNKRKNKDYAGSPQELRHVREVMTLMQIVTRDNRFIDEYNKVLENGGEPKAMCEVLDRIEAKGVAKGEAKGKYEALAQVIGNGLATVEDVAAMLHMSVSELQQELARVQKTAT